MEYCWLDNNSFLEDDLCMNIISAADWATLYLKAKEEGNEELASRTYDRAIYALSYKEAEHFQEYIESEKESES